MPLDGQTLGHYRLLRLIGKGGMGEVYLAEDIHIGRQVAIKVVQNEQTSYPNEQTTKDAARLFQREMKAISALDHTHVLPLYDYGETSIGKSSIAYMVMPYRSEGSLDDWLQQRQTSNPLSPEEVSNFISQAADALQHAHEHHLVHQDVKSSNFLVRNRTGSSSQPDILLTDFGVAKFTTATTTASQNIRGTPAYMAPEQWEGEPVPATDQYALAVMAYLLLTGRPPFVGRMEQVMRQHFNVTPQAPSTINSRISPALDAVILRALEKKPENRFATITDFANAFAQAVKPSIFGTFVPTVHQNESEQKQPEAPVPVSLYTEPTVRSPQSEELVVLDSTATVASLPPEVQKDERPIPPRPPSRPRSRIRTSLIIGLVLVVILSSIVSFFVYQSNVNQQNLRATASAQDATSQAIAVANAHITATAQAYVRATATVIAANPYPYPQGHGTLVLYDPLSHQDSWSNSSNTAVGGSCQFSNKGLVISQSQSSSPYYCAEKQSFSNFAFQVQMTFIQGDCGGILFRGDMSKGSFYYFRLCPNGTYQVRSYANSSSSSNPNIMGGGNFTQTGSGQTNTIAVVANGNTLTFYINKQEIDSAQDGSYSTGQLAFFAENDGDSTQISFSNARVWTLQ
ncbi:MAG TPA: hypothetical protein DHW02_14375 [Ktedonobacter sp.]|nr:hypothetical protein [Ktedonobacter sp.]